MGRSVLWTLLALGLLLAVPSSGGHWFDGLPFSRLSELAALLVCLPLVASRALRRLADRALANVGHGFAIGALVLLLAALGLKGVLLKSQAPQGFLACYESAVPDQPSRGCEQSYENLFGRWSVTRVDSSVDFGPNDWNLSFFNSLRFNYDAWKAGVISRTRLPFKATWVGDIRIDEAGRLEIRYAGEGSVKIGDEEIRLRPSYARVRGVRRPLPSGRHHIVVSYTFDDGYRTGPEEPGGPYATLRLIQSRQVGENEGRSREALLPAPTAFIERFAGRIVDATIILILAGAAVLYAWLLRRHWRWILLGTGAAIAAAYMTPIGQHHPILVMGVGALGWSLLFGRRARTSRLLLAYLVLVALGFGWRASTGTASGAVLIREGGSDWLLYESFARSILETGSLRAGEDVFYFQPLSRYLRFGEHVLVGDGDTLVTLIELLALNLSVLTLCWICSRRLTRDGVWIAAAGSFLLVALVNSEQDVIELMRRGASETLTWVLLPISVGWLFAPGFDRSRMIGVAGLAASVITRINQAPAILWIFVVFLAVNRRQPFDRLASWLLMFAAVGTLPLAHNLYYGGQFVLGTTSGTIPQNLQLDPRQAHGWFDLAGQVQQRLESIFYYGRGGSYYGGGRLVWIFRGLQIAWAAALCVVLVRRPVRWSSVALASTPAFYLTVHLFYQVTQYYPRHIVAGHLAMGVLATWLRSRPSQGDQP